MFTILLKGKNFLDIILKILKILSHLKYSCMKIFCFKTSSVHSLGHISKRGCGVSTPTTVRTHFVLKMNLVTYNYLQLFLLLAFSISFHLFPIQKNSLTRAFHNLHYYYLCRVRFIRRKFYCVHLIKIFLYVTYMSIPLFF